MSVLSRQHVDLIPTDTPGFTRYLANTYEKASKTYETVRTTFDMASRSSSTRKWGVGRSYETQNLKENPTTR